MEELTKEQYNNVAEFLKSIVPRVTLTRNATPVIILSDKSGGDWAGYLGVYWNGVEWIPTKWMLDGRFPSINEKVVKSDLDLMLPKENESPVIA